MGPKGSLLLGNRTSGVFIRPRPVRSGVFGLWGFFVQHPILPCCDRGDCPRCCVIRWSYQVDIITGAAKLRFKTRGLIVLFHFNIHIICGLRNMCNGLSNLRVFLLDIILVVQEI